MQLFGTFSSKPTHLIKALVLALLGSGLWCGSPVQAAQHMAEMSSYYRFNPSYLEIEVNDIVTWVNRDWADYHSSVSTDGYWDSGDLDYGETYSLQFPVTGTFGYQDYFYWILGMTGTIVVKPVAPVQPAAPTLVDPMRLQDGRFQFSLSNLTVSATYVIAASADLVNWTNVFTNVAASTSETWTDDSSPVLNKRFYRCWVSQ